MKEELIEYLKNSQTLSPNVNSLWGEAKEWAKSKGLDMGGGYASWQTKIDCWFVIGKNQIRFNIDLSEIL